MIKVYDEQKDYICMSANTEEEKQLLEEIKSCMQTVRSEDKDKSFIIIVRKTEKNRIRL